jgi:hypothetical protein
MDDKLPIVLDEVKRGGFTDRWTLLYVPQHLPLEYVSRELMHFIQTEPGITSVGHIRFFGDREHKVYRLTETGLAQIGHTEIMEALLCLKTSSNT